MVNLIKYTLTVVRKIKRKAIIFYLIRQGANIKSCLQINHCVITSNPEKFSCGASSWIDFGSIIDVVKSENNCGNVSIGDFFYCNRYVTINSALNITIGSRVQIGPYVYICDFDHDLTSNLEQKYHRPITKFSAVNIEDEVWIGAHSVILKGVRIGRASVVAAGSVVNCDVPAGVVVGGVPAKIIKLIGK